MKLIHILENHTNQVKSYDKVYGKIMLDVIKPNFTEVTRYEYKGKTHRNDGKPALVWKNGTKKWYVDGELHNESGHAVEWGEGGKNRYFLKGKEYTEEEWKKKLGKK